MASTHHLSRRAGRRTLLGAVVAVYLALGWVLVQLGLGSLLGATTVIGLITPLVMRWTARRKVRKLRTARALSTPGDPGRTTASRAASPTPRESPP